MGCDIHMWAEIREDWRPDEWQAVGHVFPYAYHRPDSTNVVFAYDDEPESESNPSLTRAPYSNRNYMLFALLAGVRNYDEVEPISAPRGVPDNASMLYQREVARWGDDGHSHSWLGLVELTSREWSDDLGRLSDWRDSIDRLAAIRAMRGVIDLRIVFFFDN